MSVNREGARTARQYDAMAVGYAEFNEINAANAHYERPATIALLGDVAGKRVLEVGCGAGPLTEWLVANGAQVVALDVSAEMVRLAKARVGSVASVRRADLHEGLGFVETGAVDVVVASLVLHYLRDWRSILAEFRRVVSDDGFVVFSTHHPAWDWQESSASDYFAIFEVTDTWIRAGAPFEVTFWRRPLRAMTRAISAAGFFIDELVEADPLPELASLDPVADHQIRTQPFFLHFRLTPRPRAGAGGREPESSPEV